MGGYSSHDPDYGLWLSFRKTHEAIHKVRKVELRPYRLSTVETAVLLTVHEANNKVTPAEISRWIIRKPNTISDLLGRMEKKGLVRKTKDLDRENLVRVSLTKKGKGLYEKSTKIKPIREVLSSLSKEDRKQLWSYLETLRNKSLRKLRFSNNPPFP